MISWKIPSLTAQFAAMCLNYRLEPQITKHSAIWHIIFKCSDWLDHTISKELNPILIETRLHTYNDIDEVKKMLYVILETDDTESDFIYFNRVNLQLFLECLQLHIVTKCNKEIFFFSEISLNVHDILCLSMEIVTDIEKIFLY